MVYINNIIIFIYFFFVSSIIVPYAERIKSKLLAMCDEKNGSMSRHGYKNIFVFQVR